MCNRDMLEGSGQVPLLHVLRMACHSSKACNLILLWFRGKLIHLNRR